MNADFYFYPIAKFLNIQKKTADALARLNIYKVKDLLFSKPHRVVHRNLNPDLAKVVDGEDIATYVVIVEIDIATKFSRKRPSRIQCMNQSGEITLVFFNPIPPFMLNRLQPGKTILISGKIEKYLNQLQISHPEIILDKNNLSGFEPIYPLTYAITNRQLVQYINKALTSLPTLPEWIPPHIIKQYNWFDFATTLKLLHKPKSIDLKDNYLKRLAFDELLANQIALGLMRQSNKAHTGITAIAHSNDQHDILQSLGFTLTEGQELVLHEIAQDSAKNERMIRLLQGDVGAGKTLVALLSMLPYIENHYQATIMAPTDILASQHFDFFHKAFAHTNYNCALLTGKTPIATKRKIYAELAEGKINILIGTHALFQDKVAFANLGYVIIDEQHRFGVMQRAELINKGDKADVLIMSATPIPRTLAMTLFGDMEVSSLKTKPKGRLPIITSTLSKQKIHELIEAIKPKLHNKEKVYWVCPLVARDDSTLEDDNYKILMDTENRAKALEEIFPGKVAVVHGKMKPLEKEAKMAEFKSGDKDILVATTVIEVGVDVPEASLIVIEDADRFGLSQLHQLRGRVGRGQLQSYCILLYNYPLSDNAKQRLAIMKKSSDGFYLAEEDLKLRGGGELIGTKQSGDQEFIFANLYEDLELLTIANQISKSIISKNLSVPSQYTSENSVAAQEKSSDVAEQILDEHKRITKFATTTEISKVYQPLLKLFDYDKMSQG